MIRIVVCTVLLAVHAVPAFAVCGDGNIDGNDACDDGNTRDGDGCSATCTVEAGYTCATVNALASQNPGFEQALSANDWVELVNFVDRLDETAQNNCYPAGEGGYSIDLNGLDQAVIAQKFDTVPGRRYVVRFLGSANCITQGGQPCDQTCQRDLSVGVAADTAAADLDDISVPGVDRRVYVTYGSPQTNGPGGAHAPWQAHMFDFVATADKTILFFSGDDNNAAGPMLDDIVIPVSACVRDTCGDGNLDQDEVCDDGNNVGGDGCSMDCQVGITPVCGDADKVDNEACDDGDNDDGDGCSANCTVETGWVCATAPPSSTSTCSCAEGYEIDEGSCADIDECEEVDCGDNSTCVNTPGSYSCECDEDYVLFGGRCTLADPCSANPCDDDETCRNTSDLSYECADLGSGGNKSSCANSVFDPRGLIPFSLLGLVLLFPLIRRIWM